MFYNEIIEQNKIAGYTKGVFNGRIFGVLKMSL